MDKTKCCHRLALSDHVRLLGGLVELVLKVLGLLMVEHLNRFRVLRMQMEGNLSLGEKPLLLTHLQVVHIFC